MLRYDFIQKENIYKKMKIYPKHEKITIENEGISQE
jgi:hypothetical protein